jgi:hypothetical protein
VAGTHIRVIPVQIRRKTIYQCAALMVLTVYTISAVTALPLWQGGGWVHRSLSHSRITCQLPVGELQQRLDAIAAKLNQTPDADARRRLIQDAAAVQRQLDHRTQDAADELRRRLDPAGELGIKIEILGPGCLAVKLPLGLPTHQTPLPAVPDDAPTGNSLQLVSAWVDYTISVQAATTLQDVLLPCALAAPDADVWVPPDYGRPTARPAPHPRLARRVLPLVRAPPPVA